MFYKITILLFSIYVNDVFAENSCEVEKLFLSEKKLISMYRNGKLENLSTIVFNKNFLPLPTRFSFMYDSSKERAQFSSVIHTFSQTYLGCKSNNIPRGIISIQKFKPAELCDFKDFPENTSLLISQKEKDFFLTGFLLEDLWIMRICSDSSYIDITDYNNSIVENWWSILTGMKINWKQNSTKYIQGQASPIPTQREK